MKLIRVLMLGLSLVWSGMAAVPPTDDEIYDKVRIELANDRSVNGGAIDVVVEKGVVQLNGTVKAEKQRVKAEKVTRKVKGVHKVVNNLKIAPVS